MKIVGFAWSIFILLNINFFTFASFLPWLTSSRSDELVMLSVITVGILSTINYVAVIHLIKMYKGLKNEKNN
jgi:hypothetical protein